MTIRCITFDLDDTFWECPTLIERAEGNFYEWLRERYPKIPARYSPEELVAHRRAHFSEHPERGYDLTFMRKHWLKHLAEEIGYDETLVEPGFRVFWEARNDVTLFDGTEEILKRLATRYAMGIITNGNADVHYIGIGHHFDFVVTPGEAGAAKPSPMIFNAALAKANTSAAETVHVGDDPRSDVLGAKDSGFRSVWYNPVLKPWPGGSHPDAVIQSLQELESVLENW